MTRGRELDCAVRRNYVLDIHQADRVDAMAATTQLNKSEIVRAAIDAYTEDNLQKDEHLQELREENQNLRERIKQLETQLAEHETNKQWDPDDVYFWQDGARTEVRDRETDKILAVNP